MVTVVNCIGFSFSVAFIIRSRNSQHMQWNAAKKAAEKKRAKHCIHIARCGCRRLRVCGDKSKKNFKPERREKKSRVATMFSLHFYFFFAKWTRKNAWHFTEAERNTKLCATSNWNCVNKLKEYSNHFNEALSGLFCPQRVCRIPESIRTSYFCAGDGAVAVVWRFLISF